MTDILPTVNIPDIGTATMDPNYKKGAVYRGYKNILGVLHEFLLIAIQSTAGGRDLMSWEERIEGRFDHLTALAAKSLCRTVKLPWGEYVFTMFPSGEEDAIIQFCFIRVSLADSLATQLNGPVEQILEAITKKGYTNLTCTACKEPNPLLFPQWGKIFLVSGRHPNHQDHHLIGYSDGPLNLDDFKIGDCVTVPPQSGAIMVEWQRREQLDRQAIGYHGNCICYPHHFIDVPMTVMNIRNDIKEGFVVECRVDDIGTKMRHTRGRSLVEIPAKFLVKVITPTIPT